MRQASSQHRHARPQPARLTCIGMLAPTPAFMLVPVPHIHAVRTHATCTCVRLYLHHPQKKRKKEKNTRTRWGIPRTHRNDDKQTTRANRGGNKRGATRRESQGLKPRSLRGRKQSVATNTKEREKTKNKRKRKEKEKEKKKKKLACDRLEEQSWPLGDVKGAGRTPLKRSKGGGRCRVACQHKAWKDEGGEEELQ
jgi:hypothetical protein